MSEIFNENQLEYIQWWLYEDVEKKLYDSKTKKETHDLTTVNDLYKYIMEDI